MSFQRGGAVRTLTGMYADAAAMRADLDFLLVDSHGETTADHNFFMVPADTYILFTAHSGTYAYGIDPQANELLTGADQDTYFQMLYDRLFVEGGSKMSPELYIYEPGDLIPDYVLAFRNNLSFFGPFGVYALPLANPLGLKQMAFLGSALGYAKRLLDAGILKEEEIAHLTGAIATDLRTKTADEIDATDYADIYKQLYIPARDARAAYLKKVQAMEGVSVYDRTPLDRHPMPYSEMPLLDKLEYHCCRGNPDNRIRDLLKPSMDYELRLMNLLRKPALAAAPGKKRFLVLHFCRVSAEDNAADYAKPHPRLIRALSFSGKCSAARAREEALNMIGLAYDVCHLDPHEKAALVATSPGRSLIAILKRVLQLPWATCLPEEVYTALTNSQRIDLVSDHLGYMTTPDLVALTTMYESLAAFPAIARRLATLAKQLEKVTATLAKLTKEKLDLIRDFYTDLHAITGFGMNVAGKITDFLNLRYSATLDIHNLQRMARRDLEKPEHPLFGEFKRVGDPERDAELLSELKDMLVLYLGMEQAAMNGGPIEIELIPDESIAFVEEVAAASKNSSNSNSSSSSNSSSPPVLTRADRRRATRKNSNSNSSSPPVLTRADRRRLAAAATRKKSRNTSSE